MTRPRLHFAPSPISEGASTFDQPPRRRKALSLVTATAAAAGLAAFGGVSAANAASTTITLNCTSTAGGVIDIVTDYGPEPEGGYPSLSVSVNYGPFEQSAVPNADGIYAAQVPYDNASFSHIVVGFTNDPNRYLAYDDFEAGSCDPEPTPTPTPTETNTPTPTPTPTETVTPTPEPTSSPTSSPSPTVSPTDTPSPTPSVAPVSIPSPSSTPGTPVLAVTGIDPVATTVGGGVGALLLAAGIAVVLFVRRRSA